MVQPLASLLALFTALAVSAQSPWPELDRRSAYSFLLEGVAYPGGPSVYEELPNCERIDGHPTRAKQWIRTAIYDSLDYDPVTNTGGLDASIFYEIDRLPPGIQDDVRTTAQDLESFTSKHLSRADSLAGLAILGIMHCAYGDPFFNYGRIDAIQASPPSTSYNTSQLFTQSELETIYRCRLLDTAPSAAPLRIVWPSLATDYEIEAKEGFLTLEDQLVLRVRARVGLFSNGFHLTLHWCDEYGDNARCTSGESHQATLAVESCPQGPLTMASIRAEIYNLFCDFKVPIDPALSAANFWFSGGYDGSAVYTYNNGGETYHLQDDIFFVPAYSKASAPGVDIVVAVKSSIFGPSPAGQVVLYDYGLLTSTPPEAPLSTSASTLTLDPEIAPRDGYVFFKTRVDTPRQAAGGTATIDVVLAGNGTEYRDDFRRIARIDGWLGKEIVPYTPISA